MVEQCTFCFVITEVLIFRIEKNHQKCVRVQKCINCREIWQPPNIFWFHQWVTSRLVHNFLQKSWKFLKHRASKPWLIWNAHLLSKSSSGIEIFVQELVVQVLSSTPLLQKPTWNLITLKMQETYIFHTKSFTVAQTPLSFGKRVFALPNNIETIDWPWELGATVTSDVRLVCGDAVDYIKKICPPALKSR